MREVSSGTPSRRALFAMIGRAGGSALMYQAMTAMGYAGESGWNGPLKLSGDVKGARVLILGAGLAGMAAALELRDAGYAVTVLEYNARAGGRNWSLKGGDRYTELGGATQEVRFDPGHYLNPGPWRLPHHHYAILDYCKRLKVTLEPFIMVNYSAYLHHTRFFGGTPRRYREVQADFQGHVAELLAKSTRQSALEEGVTREDREMLLAALKDWGALDADYHYAKGMESANKRGFVSDPGGGLDSREIPSDPAALRDVLGSGLWGIIGVGQNFEMQSPMFQPVGGMGRIGEAFGRALGPLIRYDCKVIAIRQDERGVTATYIDAKTGGAAQTIAADFCLCTLPLSILGQIPMNVGPKMKAAIDQLQYAHGIKTGLQFKRRFWEEDEQIYGGITYTDLPIGQIGYPMSDYFGSGKGVLLGAAAYGEAAFHFAAMSPEERVKAALADGRRIHPQYDAEFENGVSVAWARAPFALGCFGLWSDEGRAAHYDNLCALDGRILLAGEHASRLPGWQEGAVLSAQDAVKRLHKRVLAA